MSQKNILTEKEQKIEAVKKMIEVCGGTQRAFAEYVGIDPRTVQYWVKNGAPIHRYKNLIAKFKEHLTPQEIFPELF